MFQWWLISMRALLEHWDKHLFQEVISYILNICMLEMQKCLIAQSSTKSKNVSCFSPTARSTVGVINVPLHLATYIKSVEEVIWNFMVGKRQNA